MKRVILITFGFLGWAWFEMSGGSDFTPGENGVTMLARVDQSDLPPSTPQPAIAPAQQDVARADTTETDLSAVRVAAVVDDALNAAKAADVTADASSDRVVFEIPAQEAQPVALPQTVLADLRVVTGSRVNLRDGPGTDFGVVTQLLRGEEVEILTNGSDGWVELRALDGDNIGWMAERFLAAVD